MLSWSAMMRWYCFMPSRVLFLPKVARGNRVKLHERLSEGFGEAVV